MDSKSLPTLDPKLKEAYDRVMSTNLPPAQPAAPTPPPQQTPPAPAATPGMPPTQPTPAAPVPSAPMTIPQPTAPTPPPNLHAVSSPTHGSTFVSGQHTQKSGGGLSPILLVIAGLIFFAVYTIFWLRFFNVTLPFIG